MDLRRPLPRAIAAALLTGALATPLQAEPPAAAPAGQGSATRKPAPAPAPGTAAPGTPGQPSGGAQPAGPPGQAGTVNPCDYIDAAAAAALVGPEGTASSAPSRGAFISCGYTSPAGDSLTLYVSDYGLPQVAQQFFERNRDTLKTAVDDETLGVPAFTHRTAEQPFKVTLGAVQGARTVLLEALGPLATAPQGAPHLRAILAKTLEKLPAAETPPPPQN